MTLSWSALPRGAFSGIEWSRPGAADGYDPYLVWAEATRFAAADARVPRWLPMAVELAAGVSIARFVAAGGPDWLRVPRAYLDFEPAGLRFCTARVRPAFFQALAPGGPLHGLVRRFELGLPVEPPGEEPYTHTAGARPGSRPLPRLPGKVVALIDDSLAVAHAKLQQAGRPRTAFFWRQDSGGRGRAPADFGYGHELDAERIADVMAACRDGHSIDEDAVYSELGLSALGRPWPHGQVPFHALDLFASHGTHVADLAAGPRTLQARTAGLPPDIDAPPSWSASQDGASHSPLVAVQLDTHTVADTSGGSMNVAVMDGLMYILSRCEPQAQVAVNISFGTLAGPHDGSSWLEAAMDALLGLRGSGLHIAIAAGNSYQLRTHANLTLAPGTDQSLRWRVQPDDRSPSFLELWLEPGRHGIAVELTPPGGQALAPLRIGESGRWLGAKGQPLATVIYPRSVATGDHGTCVLLALAPTTSFAPEVETAPSGVWQVRLVNEGPHATVVDGYVERDDVVIGARGGARQSHFEDDPALDPAQQYDMQAFVDDPRRSTPIRRSGNFNSIATGARTTAVGGGVLLEPQAWARYSPRRPDPDAERARRPGVRTVPSVQAPSDASRVQHGVLAAGSRSAAMVPLAGTSAAAPQWLRDWINQA